MVPQETLQLLKKNPGALKIILSHLLLVSTQIFFYGSLSADCKPLLLLFTP